MPRRITKGLGTIVFGAHENHDKLGTIASGVDENQNELRTIVADAK